MGTTTQDRTEQTSALPSDAGKQTAKKKPEPITLRSPHDFTLTTRALEQRVEDLKKLATKNRDDGYLREAMAIEADAAAIEHAILPQFRSQRELPLVSHEKLAEEIEAALRVFVYRAFDGFDDPKMVPTAAMVHARRNSLVATLRDRVTLFAQDIARNAFDHGYQARQLTPESLASRNVRTLSGRAD